MNKSNELLEGPVLGSLLKLAGPIVLVNMLQAAYQLVDAFWVGRLGGAAVAAVSVSTPVVFLSMALGMGFAMAGSILIAQYYGAGNMKNVSHIAAQTLLLVAVLSVTLGIVGWLLSPFFLSLLNVSSDVYDGALGFLRVSFIGLAFNFSFFVFQSIMRGIGQVTIPVYIVLGTVILNFLIDPILIFGYGPFQAHGVMGAALATLSTQIVACGLGYMILFRGKHGVKLQLSDFKPDFKHIKRAFNLGFPASIEQSMRALGIMLLTFLIAAFGTVTVAIYGAASNILQVVLILGIGFSMAISTVVGQNIGAGNIERASQVAFVGARVSFAVLSTLGIIVWFTAPHLVEFFVPDDPAIIKGGTHFLRIMCLSWGFLGLQLSFTGVFRAAGSTLTAMILTLISQWVLQFPLAYVLSHNTTLGVDGIWWAFPISNVAISLITIAVFAKGHWKKQRLTDEEVHLSSRVAVESTGDDGVLR
ncbi:MAG: MATE family efflux transporter [Flavobacterium sp.]|nr:MATE family efflux transporter [Flavobacterium sp.]